MMCRRDLGRLADAGRIVREHRAGEDDGDGAVLYRCADAEVVVDSGTR